MIISKTPFRVSFAGGATDLREFYSKAGGCVLSTTIDKYMYIAVHRPFEKKIILKYSQVEVVDNKDEIKHHLIRECLKFTPVPNHIQIDSFADIPYFGGSGLGSSSAFTVGLLNCLYAFDGQAVSKKRLAEEACRIEIEKLGKPIGKQDQYACALGGLNFIEFNPDESVRAEELVLPSQTRKELDENLVMFFLGDTRSSSEILSEQKKNTVQKKNSFENLLKMKELAIELKDAIASKDLTSFGQILDKNWKFKKQLASKISNSKIDLYYKKAMEAGAAGGKVLGAGGGGFLLFYCEKPKQERLRAALKDLLFYPKRFETEGAKIIFLEG